MALMLQREVAERWRRPTGSRVSVVSVLTQLYCDVEPGAARAAGRLPPPPKVESAVIRLGRPSLDQIDVPDERWFHVVVRAAFAQRRKTLANALTAGLGRPADALRAAAEAAGIDPSRRAETLTILSLVSDRQLS